MAKGIAVFTLPLYTGTPRRKRYGAYNSLLTTVILASIVLRLGVGEAFVRFYFTDEDAAAAHADRAHRDRHRRLDDDGGVADRGSACGPPVRARAGLFDDPLLMDCAILGLWAFTNIEMAYAQLRVDERARAYMFASGANVAMTVVFTIALVVFAGQGARGLLLGNFGASRDCRAGPVVGVAQALLAASESGRTCGAMLELRLADRARRRERVCAAGGGSLLPVPRSQPRCRRRIRDRGAVGDGGVRVRARLPVRVAAACLFDRQRHARPRGCTRL